MTPSRITDRALTRLGRFPRLESLDLDGTQITDMGLASLAGLEFLEGLSVRHVGEGDDYYMPHVTGSGMPSGDRLPRLREIDASFTEWNDEGADRLASIKSLESVGLSGCDAITDRALISMAALPRLRRLKISVTAGPGMASIANMARLEDLDVSPVCDKDMPFIARAANLRELKLAEQDVSDAGGVLLASLRKLQHLDLRQTKISDRSMAAVAGLPNLYWLSVAGTAVSDRGLRELAKVKSLVYLDLNGTKVTMDGMRAILPQMRSLTGVAVTVAGVGDREADELERLLPHCRIEFGSLAKMRAREGRGTRGGNGPQGR